jgi:hypothetical protein
MTARPAGFPGPDRPVPFSLTARAMAELAEREPESGCTLPASVLHAMADWAYSRPPGTSARLLAELIGPEGPEQEAGL